ncbi:MAG: flagellar hook-associated protein FlgK [Lachnospiraceae bacterium]|nr:flagellar hook-associated protein FlgK [Lachnospiraceae bacterium]
MGAFYVGNSGLQTSQNALNTTAHNLANIDTTGYTRQQVYQENKYLMDVGVSYNNKLQVGLGVSYSEVRAVRDFFMDRQYRTDAGRSSYYSTSYEVIQEINTMFGETEGAEFQTAYQDLRDVVMDLGNAPTDPTVQSEVISRSLQFLNRAQSIYEGLVRYQNNLNQQIQDQVGKINDYANQIVELNEKIVSVEAAKVESANDLRDARDSILDKLSSLGRITYSENGYGMVDVQFEGVDLVKGNYANPMEAKVLPGDEDSGFYTPVWSKYEDQNVFNMKQEISADVGSDVGSLKALVISRGTKNATYKDMEEQTVTDKNGNPVTLSAFESFDLMAGSPITAIMTEFDHLINGIVTGMNNLLADPLRDTDGELILDSDGNPQYQKEELFSLITTMEDGGGYTTANLRINPDLLRQPTLLNDGFVLEDLSTDQETADALVAMFQDDFSTLNPGTTTPLNFEEYYIDIVDQYANIGNAYKVASEAQEQALLSAESSRQQVVGVSDNEELTKMVRYQNAYNSSSRYINTINSMLDTLITMVS